MSWIVLSFLCLFVFCFMCILAVSILRHIVTLFSTGYTAQGTGGCSHVDGPRICCGSKTLD